MTAYEVDVDELTSVIAAMSTCQQDLVDLAGAVEDEVQRLHAEWTGLARDAHAESNGLWRIASCDMSTHLAALRDVADVARANYTAAIEANIAMWEQVR